MIDPKILYRKFKFHYKNFTSNSNHLASQLANVNRLYYHDFNKYPISEHLSILKNIFINIKSDSDINYIINHNYIKLIFNHISLSNELESTYQLLQLISSYRIPIQDSTLYNLTTNVLSHYSHLSTSYNTKIFTAIDTSIKHAISIKDPNKDKLLSTVYKKLNDIVNIINDSILFHQATIYDIDEYATSLISSIHLLMKYGYSFDYSNIVNMFVSDGISCLSTNTLISILYSLLDIEYDYIRLYTNICNALNYRLFMMDKAEVDNLLQILYMHRVNQRYKRILLVDSRVNILPQILRRRYELYMKYDTINNIINPLSCITTLFGHNKVIRKLILPKINKRVLLDLPSKQYTSLIKSLYKLNLSSSNKILSKNIESTFVIQINKSQNLFDTCQNIINASKFLPRNKRKILLSGLSVLQNQLGDKLTIDEVNVIFTALDKIPNYSGNESLVYAILNHIITLGDYKPTLTNSIIGIKCISTCDTINSKIANLLYKHVIKKANNGLDSRHIGYIIKSFAKHNTINGVLFDIILNELEDNREKLDLNITINLIKILELIDNDTKEHVLELIRIYTSNNKLVINNSDLNTITGILESHNLGDLKTKLLLN